MHYATADSNEIDKVKQAAGLYLDVAPDGLVKSDPAKINREEAKFWVSIARVAIASLQSMKKANAAARWFGRRYRVVPPEPVPSPVPTSEDWKKTFDLLQLQRSAPQTNSSVGKKRKSRSKMAPGARLRLHKEARYIEAGFLSQGDDSSSLLHFCNILETIGDVGAALPF